MAFKVNCTPSAAQFLGALRKPSQVFLKSKIDSLESDPHLQGTQAEGKLSRYWQLNNSGQFQITYVINRKLKKVTVVSIRPVFP